MAAFQGTMAIMGGRDELVELLERAGLLIVGDWQVEEVPPPAIVWRQVVAAEAEPAVAVATDRADLVAEVNAQWHRLACEAGILGGDGTFLVHAVGNRFGRWARVRLGDGWDLAGVLGGGPGRPEFMTVSLDGDTLVGAAAGERSVRLVVVHRLRERREAAARAAAEETPREREAAWAALLAETEPTVPWWWSGVRFKAAVGAAPAVAYQAPTRAAVAARPAMTGLRAAWTRRWPAGPDADAGVVRRTSCGSHVHRSSA
ncbi:hypothetical protein ACIBAG_44765 [Streptomyces sp. NPDC051243]|uniref:hypothetical protein n=1 Tax=Streptomyces sp. NPDC051243 TaxID=3365646 RepID=UPI0037B2BA08